MQERIIYRNLMYEDLINRREKDLNGFLNRLISFGNEKSFTGNIWQIFLTYNLVYNENPFSISCENQGNINNSLREFVLHDIKIFMELFKESLFEYNQTFSSLIKNFTYERKNKEIYNKDIKTKIEKLSIELSSSKSEAVFYSKLVEFYQLNGVGYLGFHKAFRVSIGDRNTLIPIETVDEITFDNLIGYTEQKNKIISNTKAFILGNEANNVLLYGDSGTGKSSSIKATLNLFYSQGLRMIEIYKHQLSELANVIDLIKNRNYKFIIYMDDLSFEDYEVNYKYLKSVIDGGLDVRPQNTLVYATSNRRHLIKENKTDNGDLGDDDLHRLETQAEKLSLASRFGLSILYLSPDNEEFKNIVKELANKSNIRMSEEELLNKATKWELRHGGLSGRVAQQFISFIISGGEI